MTNATQYSITFDDVLLVPAYNHMDSRRDVSLTVQDKSGKFSLDLPVMTSNMDTVTEHEMATFIQKRGGIGVLHRFCSIDDNVKLYKKSPAKTFVSVGASDPELKRVEALRDAGAGFFCVDVAHGHAKYVGKMIKKMREMLTSEHVIMAGNVATYAGADYLSSVGADLIKVGIGPGSVCTTRIKTGYGVPQLTAILNCARVDRSIVADGGLRTAGDIVKALAFGADFVMIGGMLAGTQSTPGEKIKDPKSGQYFKNYRGMASKEANEDHFGGLTEWKTAEGISTQVPYREDEEGIISDIIGGLRSGLTYAGAGTIKELQRKLEYTLVTPAGRIESLPHKAL